MGVENLVGYFFDSLRDPGVISKSICHDTSESNTCQICGFNKGVISLSGVRKYFSDLIITSSEGGDITHSFDKKLWSIEVDPNAQNYNVMLLEWVIEKGGYYSYSYAPEEDKKDLATFIGTVRRDILVFKARRPSYDIPLKLDSGQLRMLSYCAKGFIDRVNPSLSRHIKPLLDFKNTPTTPELKKWVDGFEELSE